MLPFSKLARPATRLTCWRGSDLRPWWGAVLEPRRVDRQRGELWLLGSTAVLYGHESRPNGTQGVTLFNRLAHRANAALNAADGDRIRNRQDLAQQLGAGCTRQMRCPLDLEVLQLGRHASRDHHHQRTERSTRRFTKAAEETNMRTSDRDAAKQGAKLTRMNAFDGQMSITPLAM